MTCPDCGGQTIDTPAGHLNPQPGRLGRHARDGVELTPDEIRDRAVRGYYPHHCPPATTRKPTTASTSQDSLF